MSGIVRAPLFFREACKLAGRRKLSLNYSYPGYEILERLGDLCPDDAAPEAWDAVCDELHQACAANDRDAILRWFAAHLPGCLCLIQTRARPKFVDGVIAGWAARQSRH